jgi:hypothetical protein
MRKKVIISVVLLIIVVPILFWMVTGKIYKKPGGKPTPIPTKTYKNPSNTYKINIPANWQQKQSNATSQNGGNKQDIEITNLYAEDGTGITIQTIKGPISCSLVKKPNATLAGLPAVFNEAQQMWTLSTTTATYLITYSYPGAQPHHLQNDTDDTVSQEDKSNNKDTVNKAITSFLPTNLETLQCP